jgi:xylulose-5-phosphate/fructose-6-phosphate phosphoketolase
MDVIDRVPRLQVAGAHAKEKFRNRQIACLNYSHEHGVDEPTAQAWKWPGFGG